MTAPANLSQLASRAEVIVHGRVVSAVSEPHPKYTNLETVVVTITVVDTLKGAAEGTHTFRQFVWDEHDSRNHLGYHKGDEVLLLLNRVNEHGLTSPVGLEQGRFHITHEANGQALAVNGNGNTALFDDVGTKVKASGVRLSARGQRAVSAGAGGPIPLDDLKQMIRGLTGANQ